MTGKIIVAVDFGTTYSAIGYALLEDGANLNKALDVVLDVIDAGWPGQGRRRSPKVPSVFKFDRKGFKYGFQVLDDPDSFCFSKLFLDPSQAEQAQRLARFSATSDSYSPGKLAEGVTHYLRSLRERAFEHMISEKGWDIDFVNRTPKEYVLSVPAIWSDRAKDRTVQCACNAGYGEKDNPASIRLVSEPEAAALYTVTMLPHCALQVGDVFVVCDAGGGTVDLATYRIIRLDPALQVVEAAVGKGDICGSVMLNHRFVEFVEKKTGPVPADSMQDIVKEFNDVIKPSFTGDEIIHNVEVDPDLPDNPAEGLMDGRLAVTTEDLKEIFDPVVSMILILVSEQIDGIKDVQGGKKTPILLVGGFGSSEYLKRQITEHFEDCVVLQPPDAWSAVVRGALMRSMVKRRKVRGAYGVKFREKWSIAKHENGKLAPFAAKHKVWDPIEQTWECQDRMEWYVKKGDEFSDIKHVSFAFYMTVGLHHSFKFEISLYAYLEGREGEDGPPFQDIDCRQIAVLRPDLSVIPRTSFPKYQTTNGEYYKVKYTLDMSFDTLISFRLCHKGISYGVVKTEYLEPGNHGGIKS